MKRDDYNDEAVCDTLRSHGVSPTAQRIQIGRFVLARPSHFSADCLYRQVNEAGNTYVSKATVYNTLGLFVEKGLLRQVLVDPSKVFYDSNMAPHHHIYDVESGELEDIDAGQVEIGGLPEMSDGVHVEGVDVVIRVRKTGRRGDGRNGTRSGDDPAR